jgi:hypothetical protein
VKPVNPPAGGGRKRSRGADAMAWDGEGSAQVALADIKEADREVKRAAKGRTGGKARAPELPMGAPIGKPAPSRQPKAAGKKAAGRKSVRSSKR